MTETDAASFSPTKFEAPRTHPELWHHAVADRLFESASQRPIVVVHGLPGSARRALVTHWLARQTSVGHRRGRPVAWISCDEEDVEPARLWSALALAVTRALGTDDPAPGQDHPFSVADAAAAVADTIARSNRRPTIVVDDAQRAGDAISTLRPFLSWLPPGTRMVIITSRSLPLAFHDLRMRRSLHELNASDVFLRAEELSDAMSTGDVQFDPAAIHELHTISGGWLFAANSMAASTDSGATAIESAQQSLPADLRRLIRDEILDGLDDHTLNLLADLALLESFTAADARAVLDQVRTDETVAVAESRGCISDDGRGTFRFQPTIASYLRSERSDVDRDHVVDLRARTSDHLRAQGRTLESVQHRLAVGDLEGAIDDVADATYGHLVPRIVDEADWTTAIEPALERSAPSPRAVAKYALALGSIGRHDAAFRWLKMNTAQQAVDDVTVLTTSAQLLAQLDTGNLLRARALRDQLSDLSTSWSIPPTVVAAMIEVSSWCDDNATARAVTARAEADTQLRSGDLLAVAAAYANNAAMTGHIREAKRLAKITLRSAMQKCLSDHAAVTAAECALAQVDYEQGDLASARCRFSAVIDRTGDGRPTLLLLSRVGLANVHIAAGALDDAQAEIEMVPHLHVGRTPSPLMDHYLAAETRLAVANGDLGRARDLVDRMLTPWRRSMWRERIAVHETTTRRAHDSDEVPYPETPRVVLERSVLGAAVALRRRDRDAVDRLLRIAVAGAIDENAVSPFFEYGLGLWPALHSVLREWPRRQFHEHAEQRAEMMRSAATATATLRISDRLERLLPREHEVLNLLLQGDSTRAIATRLFISPNTVKTHIRAVYGKLGVHSRDELRALTTYPPGE